MESHISKKRVSKRLREKKIEEYKIVLQKSLMKETNIWRHLQTRGIKRNEVNEKNVEMK